MHTRGISVIIKATSFDQERSQNLVCSQKLKRREKSTPNKRGTFKNDQAKTMAQHNHHHQQQLDDERMALYDAICQSQEAITCYNLGDYDTAHRCFTDSFKTYKEAQMRSRILQQQQQRQQQHPTTMTNTATIAELCSPNRWMSSSSHATTGTTTTNDVHATTRISGSSDSINSGCFIYPHPIQVPNDVYSVIFQTQDEIEVTSIGFTFLCTSIFNLALAYHVKATCCCYCSYCCSEDMEDYEEEEAEEERKCLMVCSIRLYQCCSDLLCKLHTISELSSTSSSSSLMVSHPRCELLSFAILTNLSHAYATIGEFDHARAYLDRLRCCLPAMTNQMTSRRLTHDQTTMIRDDDSTSTNSSTNENDNSDSTVLPHPQSRNHHRHRHEEEDEATPGVDEDNILNFFFTRAYQPFLPAGAA